jgi:hypothetical protein
LPDFGFASIEIVELGYIWLKYDLDNFSIYSAISLSTFYLWRVEASCKTKPTRKWWWNKNAK